MRRRAGAVLVGGAALALVLTACDGGGDLNGGGGGGGEATGDGDCSAYEAYGTFDDVTVTMSSTISDPAEADALEESWAEFESCTGITIQNNGTNEFESQIFVQVEGGNAPDIADFPQPGLLQRMQEGGHLVGLPDEVLDVATENFTEDWLSYGSIDGTQYGIPILGSVKSFVWYSPSMFADNGYEVPTTWDEMMDLTAQISEEQGSDTVKPWCFGIESGGATGWAGTDFLEDVLLRTAGPDVYDQWVAHEIPFNDPQIVEALDTVGSILQNPDYVNGGIGDPRSIAITPWGEAGLQILENNCFMFRAASFWEAQLPEDAEVGPDGDVYAFYLPAMDDTQPLLVGGDLLAAFNDEPATVAALQYLSSAEWANSRVGLGGVTSPNQGVDPANASSDILRLTLELMQDEGAVARFDGSDLMPSEVGAGSFWTAITEWIDGQQSTEEALTAVENSWP